MKKSFKIALGISAAVLAGTGISYAVLKNSVKKLPEDFTVTAHTGCEGTQDNSIESLVAAYDAGADIAEIDLRFDSEGRGILTHDEGAVNPPTLDEAFSYISLYSEMKVNVDVKTTDNMKDVALMAEKHGVTQRIFYTGVDEEKVETVKTETPAIPYYLNYSVDKLKKNDDEYIASLVDLVKETGAIGLNVNYLGCSKKLVEAFRKEGLLVSVWTANDILSMLMCLTMTPDNITTRYPKLLKKIIDILKGV